jgi:hypothetical protein
MAEVWDQVLISLRLDSGPRDGDTSLGSGKKIDPFTFFNTKYFVIWLKMCIFAPIKYKNKSIMKSIVLSFLVIFSATLNAQCIFKGENTFKFNKSVEIGIHGGAVDFKGNSEFGSYGAILFHVAIFGVYADIGGLGAMNSSNVKLNKWMDHKSSAWHIGYQIPITKWLTITPIYGSYKHEYGVTDGSDYTVGYSGIRNSFRSLKENSDKDYGTQISFKILFDNDYLKPAMTLHFTITNNMIYGGIGVNVGWYKTKTEKYY